jgi:N-formylglutamate deformylase
MMDSGLNFSLLCRTNEPEVPLLVHVPHGSTEVPDGVRRGLQVNDQGLEAELLKMTDWFTDELSDHALALGGMMFVNRLSRLVIDPERFPNDEEEVMANRGMGAVYTKTSDGRPLRHEGPTAERQTLLARYFEPYARAMTEAVGRILQQHGRCLILDAHSFPSSPLPYELDQVSPRPEICIGTDAFHTPDSLTEAIEELCASSGVVTARNKPFAGTYVPLQFWRKDARVASLMIEIRRDLYMDERTGQKSGGFSRTHSLLDKLTELLRDFICKAV